MNISETDGFTLIELVVVIVILGIIAAIALPRFTDLKRNARIATMHGLVSTIEGAVTMVNAVAKIEGLDQEATAVIEIEGKQVEIAYGYPAVPSSGATNQDFGLRKVVATPTGWQERHSSISNVGGVPVNPWVYWPETVTVDAGVAGCYVRYFEALEPNRRPQIDFVTTGCANY